MNLLGLLFIFCARVIDVSLSTLRLLLLVKGKRLKAASIGFCEVSVYLVALSKVLQGGINSPWQVIAYAGGFATGNFIGSLLEERLVSGYALVEVIADGTPQALEAAELLRRAGFGTTVLRGEGRAGPRYILKIVCKRQEVDAVADVASQYGFIFISDVRNVWGGHFRIKHK
jgi:uncharacterized protein YebE (UPF0316 family)